MDIHKVFLEHSTKTKKISNRVGEQLHFGVALPYFLIRNHIL